jgi:4-amino-4-deoxy-L-arabinose transferase-like glycosyltransferase
MAYFYIKFILTNVVFSLCIAGVLIRLSGDSRKYSLGELILYSLGLGPVVTGVLLYYFLLVIPGLGHDIYLGFIFLFFIVMGILGIKSFAQVFRHSKLFSRLKSQKAISIFIFLLLLVYLWNYFGFVKHIRMEGHDALIYGNFGKMYYQQQKITYAKEMKPAENGFMFQGSPKPLFSLLLTWELMLNSEEMNRSIYFDTYYRSISGYYGLLIVCVMCLWLYRKNRYLALLGLLVMLSGLRFFMMLVDHHLDSFRIFFLLVSWIWLAYSIKEKDRFSYLMFCIFSGFAAFAHLIGFVIVILGGGTYFLFSEEKIKQRFYKGLLFFLVLMLLGGIHYILEILIGTQTGFINYLQ